MQNDFTRETSDYSFKVVYGPGICTFFFHKVVEGVSQRRLVARDVVAVPTEPQCQAVLNLLLASSDYMSKTPEEIVDAVKACNP